LLRKYKSMARDAQLAGDRVQTEYYLQYADHYFRVFSESRARFEDQRRQRDDDMDEDDEGSSEGGFQEELAEGDEAFAEERSQPQERAERFSRRERPRRGDRDERVRR